MAYLVEEVWIVIQWIGEAFILESVWSTERLAQGAIYLHEKEIVDRTGFLPVLTVIRRRLNTTIKTMDDNE